MTDTIYRQLHYKCSGHFNVKLSDIICYVKKCHLYNYWCKKRKKTCLYLHMQKFRRAKMTSLCHQNWHIHIVKNNYNSKKKKILHFSGVCEQNILDNIYNLISQKYPCFHEKTENLILTSTGRKITTPMRREPWALCSRMHDKALFTMKNVIWAGRVNNERYR